MDRCARCAGTQRTLRLIGPTRTKLLLFTGRRLSGGEAVEWGLADVLADEPEQVPLVPWTGQQSTNACMLCMHHLGTMGRLSISVESEPFLQDVCALSSWEGTLHHILKDHVQAALHILEQSLSKAPLALAAAKAAVDDGHEVPLAQGMAFERAYYSALFGTEDRVEALRAFAEKRPPHFVGK